MYVQLVVHTDVNCHTISIIMYAMELIAMKNCFFQVLKLQLCSCVHLRVCISICVTHVRVFLECNASGTLKNTP